jgi:hypothetical protein
MRGKDLVYALEEINPRQMDVGDYEKWLEDDYSAEEVVSLIIELANDFKAFNEYLEK